LGDKGYLGIALLDIVDAKSREKLTKPYLVKMIFISDNSIWEVKKKGI